MKKSLTFATLTITGSILAATTNDRLNLDTMPPLPGMPSVKIERMNDIPDALNKIPEYFAEFNGEKLNKSEILPQLSKVLKSQRPNKTKEQVLKTIKLIAESALDKRAFLYLASNEKSYKFPTEADCIAEQERVYKHNGGLVKFKKRLESDGVSQIQFEEIIKNNLTIKGYYELVRQTISVSDQEVEVEYNNNRPKYTTQEKVRASHILLKLNKGATLEVQDKLNADAKAILERLNKGENFATIAKEESSCPSSAKGGDLGFFDKKSMVKPFSDAAWLLKSGEISGIVKTRFGLHIITVTDRQVAGTTPLSEVKKEIIEKLKKIKVGTTVKDAIANCKKKMNSKLLF